MNNTVTNIIMFAAGAVVASAVTWKLTKTKYERIAQEEIDSVKEVFSKKIQKEDEKAEEPDVKTGDTEYDEFIDRINECGYTYAVEANILKKGEPGKMDRPYVIPPEEFGETDYETVSLTYYADKILTDDMDELVEDVDAMVGYESLTHFGEYEEDSVFVRNDRLETDYEILLDTRNFSDVKKRTPNPVED